MKLTFHGTASVMLESDGYRIAFDPFLGIPLSDSLCRRRLQAVKFRSADAVLVTHGHFDHILDIPRLYRRSDVRIFATKTPCKTLLKYGVERDKLQLITPNIELILDGFTVRVYQGRHCRFDLGVMIKTLFKADTFRHFGRLVELLRLNRNYPENGETLLYEIEAEGKRIQLAGSMGLDALTDYPTGADALVLPFQGTADPAKTVVPIIGRLQPKSVYLSHYDDTFPPMSSMIPTVDFVAKLHARGIPAAALKRGKTYYI